VNRKELLAKFTRELQFHVRIEIQLGKLTSKSSKVNI